MFWNSKQNVTQQLFYFSSKYARPKNIKILLPYIKKFHFSKSTALEHNLQ